jgi:transposase InsO family protein
MRPPRQHCSACSTTRSTPAGHYGGLATNSKSARYERIAGSPAAFGGSWPTRHRAGRRCASCSTPKLTEILALFDDWGETDRSHRKLAHRGSYLNRVWVSPSSVHRVLFLADKHFRPLPKPGRSQRKPFPEWVDYKPNSIWIYDSTHFTRAQMAVLIIQDLVSRKWITEVVSAEETSTQVQVGFTDALDTEGLLEAVERRADGLVDLDADDANRPILLAVSDNGPQMTSGSTREFMAMCAIAQHFGRPGTPTDQARIESSRSKTLLLCAPNSPSPRALECLFTLRGG